MIQLTFRVALRPQSRQQLTILPYQMAAWHIAAKRPYASLRRVLRRIDRHCAQRRGIGFIVGVSAPLTSPDCGASRTFVEPKRQNGTRVGPTLM